MIVRSSLFFDILPNAIKSPNGRENTSVSTKIPRDLSIPLLNCSNITAKLIIYSTLPSFSASFLFSILKLSYNPLFYQYQIHELLFLTAICMLAARRSSCFHNYYIFAPLQFCRSLTLLKECPVMKGGHLSLEIPSRYCCLFHFLSGNRFKPLLCSCFQSSVSIAFLLLCRCFCYCLCFCFSLCTQADHISQFIFLSQFSKGSILYQHLKRLIHCIAKFFIIQTEAYCILL